LFDVVVTMYARRGFEPTGDTEYREFLFPDSGLTDEVKRLAGAASLLVATRVSEGRRVLSRCQAGLNRSSLVAGLAMLRLGFSGEDAVQLIRSKRSRWALCNREYEEFLSDGSATKYLAESDGIGEVERAGGAGL
jgi:protein-tyrosine phosphatase